MRQAAAGFRFRNNRNDVAALIQYRYEEGEEQGVISGNFAILYIFLQALYHSSVLHV